MVRSELNKLPMDRFIVAHDIKFKYGNIDHLIVRVDDGQIFLIESKAYRGIVSVIDDSILVNGRKPTRNPFCQVQRSIRYIKAIWSKDQWIESAIICPLAKIVRQAQAGSTPVLKLTQLAGYINGSQE